MKTQYEVLETVYHAEGDEDVSKDMVTLGIFEHYVEAMQLRNKLVIASPLRRIEINNIEVESQKCGRCASESPLVYDHADGRNLCQNCLKDGARMEGGRGY